MISEIYDIVNGDQYAPYAEFVKRCFDGKADIPVKEVLDLGCGTGGITVRLARMGYDTVGVDISPDMLMQAMENTAGENVLLLNQDMREFELYGTVQGIVCSFDTLNYLTCLEDLKKTFSLCKLYMEEGGVLAGDVNSLYRYRKVYGDNSFVYEFDDDMLVWQNDWKEEDGDCRFYLTMFTENEGVYSREDEVTVQKYFSPEEIKECALAAGFKTVELYGDKEFSPLKDTDEKIYFVIK